MKVRYHFNTPIRSYFKNAATVKRIVNATVNLSLPIHSFNRLLWTVLTILFVDINFVRIDDDDNGAADYCIG